MRAFLLALRWEIFKVFARPRTWLGFALLLVFQVTLLALLHDGAVQEEVRGSFRRLGFTFAENFTGATIAAFMVGNTMTVLGSLQVALVAGEMVSREVEEGSIRMLLCRPISRRRLLFAKLGAALIFTCAITTFITFGALALGLLAKGPGYWLIHSPKEDFVAHHEFWPGLRRFFGASALMTVSNWTVACLAFALSCLRVKPAAAAVGALALLIVDDTLRNLPYFASVKSHFIMTHVVSWIHFYEKKIPWPFLASHFAILLVLNVTVVTVGCSIFLRRDLKP